MKNPSEKSLRYLFIALWLAVGAVHAEPAPVQSVTAVDLDRYLGKWYEIAAFPMFFQRDCLGDTTAEYALRPDGDIAVTNRCRSEKGSEQAIGRAWRVDGQGGGRLKVSFFWPFRSDYWVIGLDPDYRWALVGNPNRKFLWLLSRSPQISKDDLDKALQIARSQGFDLGLLRFTSHTRSSLEGNIAGNTGFR